MQTQTCEICGSTFKLEQFGQGDCNPCNAISEAANLVGQALDEDPGPLVRSYLEEAIEILEGVKHAG